MPDVLLSRIDTLSEQTHGWLVRELFRWYRANGGRGVKRAASLQQVLDAARQRLLAHPVYYLHENTDVTTC